MLQEPDLIPFTVSPPKGNKVLILAPHPDDETLGCGGTIRLLLLRKTPVKVIFLTSGDKADLSNPASKIKSTQEHISDYALMREKEALKALSVLGVSEYEFFRFPDRELNVYYRDALDRLMTAVETFQPETLYSPSVIEINPDHRATAALALEILKTRANYNKRKERIPPTSIVFYEVTTPFRPNMLVDVTSVYARKMRAIKKYKSQIKIRDYYKYIESLNSFRTLTVEGPKRIEAFWHIDEHCTEEDIVRWLGYSEPLNKI